MVEEERGLQCSCASAAAHAKAALTRRACACGCVSSPMPTSLRCCFLLSALLLLVGIASRFLVAVGAICC